MHSGSQWPAGWLSVPAVIFIFLQLLACPGPLKSHPLLMKVYYWLWCVLFGPNHRRIDDINAILFMPIAVVAHFKFWGQMIN